MLLTLTTTATPSVPATDLGFLLHKHPGRVQSFDLPVGTAHVLYPEATEARCTAALLLEVDPVALVRGKDGSGGKGGGAGGGTAPEGFSLGQYVNDRPYAASSLLAVALKRVFSTAAAGTCAARPELAASPIPLTVRVPALPCRGGAEVARRLFEPLGWAVDALPVPLDPAVPEWGDSPYLDVTLAGTVRLADALAHLYVLLPVLDYAKHYWVGDDEVDKLLRAGTGWLAGHPERELITRRYLSHRGALVHDATARLAENSFSIDYLIEDECSLAISEVTEVAGETGTAETAGTPEASADKPVPLALQRHGAVLAVLRAAGARRVLDLGCGGGALLAGLLADPAFARVTGVDVSHRSLELAARRLKLDRLPERQRERITLLQSSLTYRDERLAGYDAAVLMEVIEHLDPSRLPALERAVFGHARPGRVVVTTPNVEHNVRFEGLAPGAFRHRDHRFEWDRATFRDWAGRVAASHGYAVRFLPVGPDDPEVGPPTQLAAFTRAVPEN